MDFGIKLPWLLEARSSRDGISVEEAGAGITQHIPAGRMGRPEELGDVVTFLASERAGFINGGLRCKLMVDSTKLSIELRTPVENLDTIAERILERLEAKNAAREEVLRLSRQLVQHASRAIRAAHRQEWEEAERILKDAGQIANDIRQAAAHHPDILFAGYTQDALKELAEAHITRALIHNEPLPTPEELQVDDAAWLNGLGEAVGEMRRHALDLIRHSDIDEAERILNAMQEVHAVLSTVDFPDAITGNLRRTNDMVRGVAERTRGDLTTAVRQEQMKQALCEFEEHISRLRLFSNR